MSDLTEWVGQDIPEAILEDAARWLAMLDSERCDEADRGSFARWLDEDPRHQWAFEELSEVWARLRTLADIEPLLDQAKVVRLPAAQPAGPAAGSEQRVSRHDWSAVAAMAIVALGVGLHLAFRTSAETIVTDTGESRIVSLSDGSVLELNARTRLEVVIDDQRRRIRLSDGEAVFHVAKDKRPFVVTTGFGSIAALGTTFNVEVGSEHLEVSVIEGQVSISTNHGDLPLTEYDGEGFRFARQAALLGAGEYLEVSGSGIRQQQLGTGEFRRRLSWRNGVVEFDQQPLQAVVEEMRRYTHVSIHVADSALSNLRISGRFGTRNYEDFLAQLHEKYGVVIDDRDADWILLRAPQDHPAQ